MSKSDKNLICVLLVIIIVASILFVFKIILGRKYDEKLYSEIYNEYNTIFGEADAIDETITKSNKKTIYMQTASDGTVYRVIASIIIPKVNRTYPVIANTTDELLKIAPCKLWGGEPNEVGNLSIIGHNYKNSEFFSKINTLELGDKVILESKNGSALTYYVFDKFEVANNDFSCTEQSTNGTIDLTLITCSNLKSRKFVVKCRANP